MVGKPGLLQDTLTRNSIADEEKSKVASLQNGSGKILIEVNVSKQNMHDHEITQIIREIFELNNRDLEVEKVVVPIGENTWQIRRTNPSELKDVGSAGSLCPDRRKANSRQNRTKTLRRNGRNKLKIFQSLNRSRQNSRRKLARKHSEVMSLNRLDVSDVHSSPAITNLLSQLYPNPYNLLNILEMQDNSMDTQSTLDASDSCRMKFEANNKLSVKERVTEHEVSSLRESPTNAAPEAVQKTCDKEMETKTAIFRKEQTTDDPPKSSVVTVPEKVNCQKLKRKMLTESASGAVNKSECMKTSGRMSAEREDVFATNDNRRRCKMATTESKIPKKRITKILNTAAEKTEAEKAQLVKHRAFPPSKEKVPISAIHPLSLKKTVSSFEEKIEQEKSESREKIMSKGKKNVLTGKKKCVVKYLKLIKDMYEEEERQLQCQINDARNFAIDQIEKPDRKESEMRYQRKNEQCLSSCQDGKCRNCQSQTLRVRQKKSRDKGEKERSCEEQDIELAEVPFRLAPVEVSNTVQPSCSGSSQPSDSLDVISKIRQNIGSCSQSQCGIGRIIQTETFVLNGRKNIEGMCEMLPIDVINTVHETNRKIDLLIRQIDDSMNWLSQSEKTGTGNITSVIENAKNLSEELEKNLRPCKPKNKIFCNRSDLFVGQSYHSLHIFPIDNGVGSFRISADSLFDSQNRKYFWPGMFRDTSLSHLVNKSNKPLLPNSSVNFVKSTVSGVNRYRSMEDERPQRGRNLSLNTEIPEFPTAPASILISVKSRNELGSFVENSDLLECESNSYNIGRKRESSKVSPAKVKTALENEEPKLNKPNKFDIVSPKTFPPTLSVNSVALDESLSNLKPVIVQEITWNFYIPAPLPVTRVLYRNERNLVFTTMEAAVLYVATTTYFLNLALMSVVQIIEQEPKQQSSIIISLHKCSSFVKNNDGIDESGKGCKFVVLPSDIHFTEKSSGNVAVSDNDLAEIKILKKAEIGGRKHDSQDRPFYWDSFPSESSTEIFDRDKPGIKRIEAFLRRTSKSQLTWFQSLPEPYESNPDMHHADLSKPKNFHAIGTSPNKDEEVLFPKINDWNPTKIKFNGATPPIFRYLSSETSNTSLDDKKSNGITEIPNKDIPLFPEIKKSLENASRMDEPSKELQIKDKPGTHAPDRENDKDSSSTSSFKSSNDCSDVGDVFDLSFPKKKAKRSHFLDKLFHELKSFRKSLAKRGGHKRRNIQEDQKEYNEFQDALSELNVDDREGREKQKVDESVAVNTTCIDEIAIPASYAMPRKIFKTSFRGKESVTELMIDLKDVSISEVSDISVEKRKLATDHTKISIVISKQGDKICCSGQANKPDEMCEERAELPSPEGSYHSLKPEKTNCLGWKKDEENMSDEDVDDEDFQSVDSGKFLENIPTKKFEDDVRIDRNDVVGPRKKYSSYGKHKFDFYKKMENSTSSLGDKEILFSGKCGKQLAPLRKAITDMQVRVRNIQKNSFCTSDEYYERALRMAKMSAGYCQLCKSKTVIPEDPLGIYQKFIPRSNTRSPYGKQRKYYFKTTSSTNSSFYSVHSSNSDISDKFCHLNSSSSIVTNGLSRSRGPVLRGSYDSSFPLFLGRTINF